MLLILPFRALIELRYCVRISGYHFAGVKSVVGIGLPPEISPRWEGISVALLCLLWQPRCRFHSGLPSII
jgi:hypothetical protein